MPVTTVELGRELERVLDRRILRVRRRPSPRRSSFPLEELDVRLEGDVRLELVFKELGRHTRAGRAAKPAFLHDPCREIEAYRLFGERQLGTARCYGEVVNPGHNRYWLFLERVQGSVLAEVGELSTWQAAGRGLARLHTAFAPLAPSLPGRPLLRYDAGFFRLWAQRAKAFSPSPSLTQLVRWHEQAIERLMALPVTLIHGEFYPSNVLVARQCAGIRVCPVDWEMTGVGPGQLDVAALTAGGWGEKERELLVAAYRDGLAEESASAPQEAEMREAVEWARLHLAVQWLGWGPEWSPPPAQTHDWLAEGLGALERLGM
jgi:aminoglycoside phosphotransferase (APT) family kinase protein